MFEKISSVQNPKVKSMLHLAKASERKEQQLFVAEGYREIKAAFDKGFSFRSIFYCPQVGNKTEINDLIRILDKETTVYEITVPVFEKMAYRENSDGIIAQVVSKFMTLENLELRSDPLIIVLEKVEKPGNLGAVLRTADAAEADAVLVCDPLTDIYNPNVIRSSIGCAGPVAGSAYLLPRNSPNRRRGAFSTSSASSLAELSMSSTWAALRALSDAVIDVPN
jgi:TrmH family RNA methyltransferase